MLDNRLKLLAEKIGAPEKWPEIAAEIEKLSDRERTLLSMRNGLEDGVSHTLEEVGRHFAVTREKIRQIEAKAVEKIKAAL